MAGRTITYCFPTGRKKIFFHLLFFLMAGILPASAQDKAPEDTVKRSEELIPATRFAGELPAAFTTLQHIRSSVITMAEISELKKDLDTIFTEIDRFSEKMARTDTGILQQKALENLIFQWQHQKERLLEQQALLEDRLETIQEKLSVTDKLLSRWRKSIEVNGQDLSQENKAVLDSFLLNALSLRDTLDRKSLVFMGFLQDVSNQIIRINRTLRILQEELKKKQKMLLSNKGPSFFKAVSGKAQGYPFMGDIGDNISSSLPPLKDYLKNKRFDLLWILLIFLSLYFLLYFLDKHKESEIEQAKKSSYIQKTLILVARPLWTSLFLSLLSARIILSSAPHDLYILLYTLSLIPLFILVPAMLPRNHRQYFYVIGSLFLVDNISELFFYGYLLNNLILMVLSVFLIITIARHNRDSIALMIFPGKWISTLVTLFNYLTIILLSATILATFFGFYNFQEYMVTAYIWIYFAIYFYNTANIAIAGLFEFIIYGKWTERYKSISKNREKLAHKIALFLNLLTFLLWLYTIVALFGFREQTASAIVAVWNFGFKAGTLDVTLGNITLFVFVLWLSLRIAKITQTVLEEDILARFHLERGIPESIATLVKYTIGIIGFFIAAGAAGMKMNNLAFIFGALGVGIGFGLQDIINNFISGLILLFERPIHIGDNISVGELEGVVKHIGIRSSIIQAYDRSEVVVPNGKLISNELINWTLSNEMRRLEIRVGVAYGTDPLRVMEILKECALSHPEVMKDPPPYVWFQEFGNSSVDFRLLFFYPRFSGGMTVRSEVAAAIVQAFEKNNITIPFPQMDVYIKEAMEQAAESKSEKSGKSGESKE